MLYIVATPIGNLGDISQRALEVLESVDIVAAEDTRHTLGMLTHFNIKKPLISYYEENKVQRGPELIKRLKEGQNIALVSDAGTPGISDPGSDIIKEALAENLEVTVVPGCAACIVAAVLSGFSTRRFVFEGFLPVDKKERKEVLDDIADEKRTCVMYEAPHRLIKTLETLEPLTEGRQLAVCRELTKKFEEVIRGTATEVKNHFEEEGIKGEFVIVIQGKKEAGIVTQETVEFTDQDIYDYIAEAVQKGKDKKEAMKEASAKFGISKNNIYSIYEKLKNQ